jgi:hypothetical protein
MSQRNVSVQRATGATVGLMAAGAVAGAAVGTASLGLLSLGAHGLADWSMFSLAASLGAICGGVGLPLVTWAFLRHVAFGRVVLAAGIGTVCVGLVATMLSGIDPMVGLCAPVVGFFAGTAWLRIRNAPSGQTA